MNYKIIQDHDKLQGFIDWLPELGEGEKFYLSLLARRKYCTDAGVEVSANKCQLKRLLCRKDNMIEKIHQLEIEQGRYFAGGGMEPIPQDGLALYIMPNPRDMKKATQALAKKAIDLVFTDAKGYNIHQEAMSCIQKSRGKGYVVDFDFDEQEHIDTLKTFDLDEFLGKDAYSIVKTRGGLHLLVRPANVSGSGQKTWHKTFSELSDVSGDCLLPVVGCCQGGAIPDFI